MKIQQLNKTDIANGPGIRTSIFVSGCDVHCPGCFNKEAWDPDSGIEFTDSIKQEIFEEFYHREKLEGISLLGGDPCAVYNMETCLNFCKEFKTKFPDKTVWVWTGHIFEDLMKNNFFKENVKYIDVLIDGPFIDEKRNFYEQWRGSSNQRILNIKDII